MVQNRSGSWSVVSCVICTPMAITRAPKEPMGDFLGWSAGIHSTRRRRDAWNSHALAFSGVA
eukprot:5103692-Amphidinium_carterae.1